ncbi:MAG: hypothetical protein AUK33_00540 [Flavobacteriaceae bacterium CG2_30_34_30]|nr:MAG: hypothetical protein AUK33_00540 [Flavobacteriaceae bacterium CG2_30_34_30]
MFYFIKTLILKSAIVLLPLQNFFTCGVRSKKFELISPRICRAGGIPPKPPFRPPAEATFSDWTISSFSFCFANYKIIMIFVLAANSF